MVALALIAALHVSVEVANGRFDALLSQGPAAPDLQPARDTLLARAESLLAAGRLADARRIAERLVAHRPPDPRVLMLLGRIHTAWPVIGRYRAESLLTRATHLSPGDPEPLYYLALTGLALGGDDGESTARRALVPLLAIDPDYRDAWALWLRLYRGDSERRDAITALGRHAGRRSADYRRAQLLIELRQQGDAIPLLRELSARAPRHAGPWAGLARALTLSGDAAGAASAYDSALARADDDPEQALWGQVRGVATPAERAAYGATTPAGRAAFFRLFWASRDPDLSTPRNERFAEHFERLAEAQRMYRLLHPNSRYFRSPLFRALASGVGGHPGGLEGAHRRALEAQCTARRPGIRDAAVQAGFAPRLDSTADAPLNLEDGLDDRGRVFLRHGPPDYRNIGSLADETWCYFLEDGRVLRVTFVRRSGAWGATGDMLVTPLMAGEAESARELLATDRPSARATMRFTFWPAAFRGVDRRHTELLLVPDSVHALATLVDAEGREVARDSAIDRALTLTGTPGAYLLLVDGATGQRSARYRGRITLPDYGGEEVAVSSVLLASGDVAPTRDGMSSRLPRGLRLPVAQPLRVFAEIYNLGRTDGVARYHAEYRFERLDGPIARGSRERVIAIGVQRERAFEPRVIESLLVDPGRLPTGHYRLRLEITDTVRGTRAASAAIEFRLR